MRCSPKLVASCAKAIELLMAAKSLRCRRKRAKSVSDDKPSIRNISIQVATKCRFVAVRGSRDAAMVRAQICSMFAREGALIFSVKLHDQVLVSRHHKKTACYPRYSIHKPSVVENRKNSGRKFALCALWNYALKAK